MIDYSTKYCLAVTICPTSRAQDAVPCLHVMIWVTQPRPSGRRCRIGAEVFVAGVRGRPRRAAPKEREPRL